jgi:hypothetical protein
METQEKKQGLLVNMMGMAGQTTHDTYLPKISLPHVPLQITAGN